MPEEEIYIEPTPPNGNITITKDMCPCEVHVLLDGIVTLEWNVPRSQVVVIPENGASVEVVGGY
jgi:hypothetical protein